MRRRSLRRVAVLSLHLVTTRGLKDVTGGVEVSFQLAYDLREFCSAMHACNYNFLSCLVNSSQYSAWLHFSLAPTQPWMRAQSPSALPGSGRDNGQFSGWGISLCHHWQTSLAQKQILRMWLSTQGMNMSLRSAVCNVVPESNSAGCLFRMAASNALTWVWKYWCMCWFLCLSLGAWIDNYVN